MKEADCRQVDLANRSGYAQPHVSKWLSGRVLPTIETMVNLDEAMHHIETRTIPEDFLI